MASEKQSGIYKLLDLNRRWIYGIVVLLMIWALLAPPGLPIAIEPMNREFYETIESLPLGTTGFLEIDMSAGSLAAAGPASVAIVQHLLDKDVKFVAYSFLETAPVLWETEIFPKLDTSNKQYGVDWVYMGFVEGRENAMSAIAKDFLLPGKDAYGTSVEDIPILKEIKSLDDVDLAVFGGSSGYYQEFIRQFSVPYKKQSIMWIETMHLSDVIVYYPHDVVSVLGGLPGVAQYEYLRGKPGDALVLQDALSMVHIFLIVLVVIVNLLNITQRGAKTQEIIQK